MTTPVPTPFVYPISEFRIVGLDLYVILFELSEQYPKLMRDLVNIANWKERLGMSQEVSVQIRDPRTLIVRLCLGVLLPEGQVQTTFIETTYNGNLVITEKFRVLVMYAVTFWSNRCFELSASYLQYEFE